MQIGCHCCRNRYAASAHALRIGRSKGGGCGGCVMVVVDVVDVVVAGGGGCLRWYSTNQISST